MGFSGGGSARRLCWGMCFVLLRMRGFCGSSFRRGFRVSSSFSTPFFSPFSFLLFSLGEGPELVVMMMMMGFMMVFGLAQVELTRLVAEERYLIRFFGEDYLRYKKRTGVGIPLIS